ncbi:MarR family transcriptional regulator [Aceticella autotrophica]|uniref:MarR family transcriptional regulator n=1 Tax=Aceticella autotrophica TaxID=2755338 RepID=A0A975AUB8_9THEO|nr:MarR family transcriptional regulator [Aceticella autotrophica]QSZ26566.1 MarR family transcriptional regulator [Aceticella autotrophica]
MEKKDQTSIEELCELFVHVVNQYNALDKMPYSYGIGQKLHLSEVHTIDAIGKHDNINITKLAQYLNVTKGAVSQMVRKLVNKNLVIKSISPETENEVVLSLTELGKQVYEGHQRFHKNLNKKIASLLAQQPPGTIDILATLSKELQKIWKEIEFEKNES